jgi:alginate O-acetyltransferase complex protein AlgI
VFGKSEGGGEGVMVFNSLTFFAFFAIVMALHAMPFSWTTKKINLLVASYVFYAAWNPPFILLLWISTVVDWWAANRISEAGSQSRRRAWMLVSVIANLGMLGWFKYGEFFLRNFQALAATAGIDYQPPDWNIILPVGISFYTFATMSYTLDVFLRRAAPTRSLLDFSLFVTFFPHLVAGPIMRPTELIPQFEQPRRATADQIRFGLALVTLGLFQKVVLADGFLADPAEQVFDGGLVPGAMDAWAGTLAFSGQIFCDFAGYSTTAIGIALCLGFKMPDNFRFPYAAVGFSDFWRRWHITLSSWLRDYLYIPLGGNRHGEARTYAALMLTMLLGGLWHGANWTFVMWGGLHGLYLAVERCLRGRFGGYRPGALVVFALGLLTYTLVNVAWVFFRATSFKRAGEVLAGMFGLNAEPVPILAVVHLIAVALVVSGIVATHWLMRRRTLESLVARTPAAVVALVWAAMAFAVIIEQGTGNAFIYFQF